MELSLDLRNKLRSITPARVAMGRTGVSQLTRDQLNFQLAHAQARDAVHAELDAASLRKQLKEVSGHQVELLHSAAPDRVTYLQRPDLGRRLDESSHAKLQRGVFDVAIVIADGLSALAIERNAPALITVLFPRISDLKLAPLTIVEQGRVAVGDEIGELLGAQLVVLLIGERPGLSSPDSLGVYVTWGPRVGRTDAERNCISNIRSEGLSAEKAAAQIEYYIRSAHRFKLTGVGLKEDSLQIVEGGA
jgi:ethanolamine ammonia-lyase small subunit